MAELQQIIGWAIVLLGVPFLVVLFLKFVVRKPFMRMIDRRLGDPGTFRISRTLGVGAPSGVLRWTSTDGSSDPIAIEGFDVGDVLPRGGLAGGEAIADGDASAPAASLSPDFVRRYREGWRVIRGRYATDPHRAVREAHRLALEIARARGSGVVSFDTTQVAADVPSALGTLRGIVDQVRTARAGAAATERVLAGETVGTGELDAAIRHYDRLIETLLGGEA